MAKKKIGSRGFTMIEVMIAAVLLAGAVLGLMAVIPTVASLTEDTQEGNLALQASLQLSEAIRQYADQNFTYTWRAYNSDPADDPNGAGTAPGASFAVGDLLDGYGSSQVGSVTFYLDETATVNEVGLPKQLNNVATDDPDVSGNYTILPFRISVDWKDHAGHPRHTDIFSQVTDY